MPYCEKHPATETELRCSRCERLICPQCMVYTPVGVRCETCAMLRRPPMYELSIGHYARAIAIALLAGIALGFLGSILIEPARNAGLFRLALGFLAGIGAGAVVAAALDRATGGKRGTAMQLIAVGALVIAAALRLVIADDLGLWNRDTAGAVLLLAGIVSSWGRLR